MGLFDGMETAQPGQGGVYLTEGLYPDLEVLAFKSIKSRKGINGFVAEVLVHESSGPNALMPGTKAAWMSMADKDSFLGAVRGILHMATIELGGAVLPIEEIDAATAELAVSDQNPYKGVHLKAQATNVLTKAKTTFTKVEWAPKSVKM